MNTDILLDDIQLLSKENDWSELYNSSILITGGTGLIGQQLIALLLCLNEQSNANIKIFALVRNIDKAKTIFGQDSSIEFIVGDIQQPFQIEGNLDFIIHGASVTQSRSFVDTPVETINTAFDGTRNILELARAKRVKSLVYLSSMEIFGITNPQLPEIKEEDYGYINILDPRSSYSEGKRMCECLCAGYSSEYKVPVKIARLTQTIGPGIDYNDTRIATLFARSVIENKDIVLQTEGKPRRPLLYTRDAISGIFTVLLKGHNGEAYTLANKSTTLSIREIAEMIAAKIANHKIAVRFNITNPKEYAFNQNLNLLLNTDKIESLGWKAEVGLEEAYRRMIESMLQESQNSK